MPITQDRMIKVLDAASEVCLNYERHRQLVRAIYDSHVYDTDGLIRQANEIASNPSASANDIRRALVMYNDVIERLVQLNTTELPSTKAAEIIVAEEKAHFKYNRKRNEQSRNSARRIRAEGRATEAKGMLDVDLSQATQVIKAPIEIEADAREAGARMQARADGKSEDEINQAGANARETYISERNKHLSESSTPTRLVRSTPDSNGSGQ